MPPPALAAAYCAADYCVDSPGGRIVLRVGRPSPAWAAALQAAGARDWAIVAAVNPRAQILADADNGRRHRQLVDLAAAAGWRAWPGVNLSPAADWPPEPTLCLLDVPRLEVLRLAGRFEQNALLAAGGDGLPALLWVEE